MLKTEDDGCFRNEIIRRHSLLLTFAHWNLWCPLPFYTAFNLGRPLQRVTLVTGEVAGWLKGQSSNCWVTAAHRAMLGLRDGITGHSWNASTPFKLVSRVCPFQVFAEEENVMNRHTKELYLCTTASRCSRRRRRYTADSEHQLACTLHHRQMHRSCSMGSAQDLGNISWLHWQGVTKLHIQSLRGWRRRESSTQRKFHRCFHLLWK